MATITVVGLGPGQWHDLTLQACDVLSRAAEAGQTVYMRTCIHPTVEPLKREMPTLHIESFDYLYDESRDWDTLYQQIAEELCTRAAQEAVIYAVPGHPLIGESSVQLVLRLAHERGISTTIVDGLFFFEPVCTTLGLDPLATGMQVIEATMLAALERYEIAGKIVPTVPLFVAQVYNRRVASAVKLALGECYPDEWLIKLVRSSEIGDDETIIELPLYDLDRDANLTNHLTTLYVPPIEELYALRVPETLRAITTRLRRDPDGCPWDRQQTHQTLTPYVIEETYEVVEALEENDMEKLAEELGDLLLQIYLHAEIARQGDEFTIGDVFEHVNAKMIRRHPHVFGMTEAVDASQVVQNWETIKQQERAATGKYTATESLLTGVPFAAPALTVAQEYQKRVAKVGFDYPNIQHIFEKLAEELHELQEAATIEHQREELGDVLFVLARVAQELNFDAEEVLRQANRKFRHRFQSMEKIARDHGRALNSHNDHEWDDLWSSVKQSSR